MDTVENPKEFLKYINIRLIDIVFYRQNTTMDTIYNL